jgi:phage recombination protein Bet
MVTKEKETAIVQLEERKFTITFDDVKKYLCPKASDAEIGLFLKVCQSEGLNPFSREIYLVKYADDQPAATIIATETFLKRAEGCPEFDGAEAGIILRDTAGKLELREGSFLLDEEEKNLVGGWAKVYRKDRQRPIYGAVNIKECIKYTKSGKPTRFWEDMPATMVRKVALSRALREAFPNRFGGTLTTAEFEEVPEGQLPPALEKNGKPDWKKFWPKVKSELGLSTEEARVLLKVKSIKEELIDQGWTMEQIWDALVTAKQQSEAKLQDTRQESSGEAVKTEAGKGQETGTAPPAKLRRDPETVKTINDLLTACHQDFTVVGQDGKPRKMQPKDVYAELNVKSANEITEKPSECYRRIAAVR